MDKLNIAELLFLIATFYISVCYAENDVEKEMQKLFRRPDLMCPDKCNKPWHEQSNRMQCCVCRSKSVIEEKLGYLDVKYFNGSETELIFRNGKSSFYGFIHPNGNLTKLPVNVCLFNQSMFSIDLSFNRIHDITGIACLQVLDTLNLRGNQIKFINNQDIVSLKFLRRLDLSLNKIKRINPGLTINMNGSLFFLDLSHNNLEYVDVTNGLTAKQQCFCNINFSYNRVMTIVNEDKWICENDTNLGYGGQLDLSNNIMEDFFDIPKFRSLGFNPAERLGKIFDYGVDIRNNSWKCDCKMFPYANLAKRFVNIEKRDYFKFKCSSPPELAGLNVIEIVKNKSLDKFVCNISMSGKCPPRCHCFYQPDVRNRTVVNCHKTGYRNLPNALPASNYLEVDFSENQVKFFPQRLGKNKYFNNLRLLNMSWNKIEKIIKTDFSPLIGCVIDLTQNPITTIPQFFRVLNPCNLYLHSVLNCKCNDKWIKEWLPFGKCTDRVSVLCNTPNGLKPIQNVSDKDLGCPFPDDLIPYISNYIVITFLCILMFGILSFSFRYEVFVIAREMLTKVLRKRRYPFYTHGVYISCNDSDPTVRKWVMSSLLPRLSQESTNVFLPCLHSELGTPREEEIINVMSECRTFLIILSARYDSPIKWHEIEWKHAWHNWARDFNRELIIVNYDMVTANEVSSKYIRACIRLGWYIDFANRNKNIERDILNRVSHNYRAINLVKGNKQWLEIGKDAKNEIRPLLSDTKHPMFYHSYNIN